MSKPRISNKTAKSIPKRIINTQIKSPTSLISILISPKSTKQLFPKATNPISLDNNIYTNKKTTRSKTNIDISPNIKSNVNQQFKFPIVKGPLPGSLKPNQLKISLHVNKNYLPCSPQNMLNSQIYSSKKGQVTKRDSENHIPRSPKISRFILPNAKKKHSITRELTDINNSSNKSIKNVIKDPNDIRRKYISLRFLSPKQTSTNNFNFSNAISNTNHTNEEKLVTTSNTQDNNIPTILLDSVVDDLENKKKEYVFYEELQIQTELNIDRNNNCESNTLIKSNPTSINQIESASCPEIDREYDNPIKKNIYFLEGKLTKNEEIFEVEKDLEQSNELEQKQVLDNQVETQAECQNPNEGRLDENKIEQESAQPDNSIDTQNQEENKDDNDKGIAKKKKIFRIPIYKKSRFFEEYQTVTSRAEIPDEELVEETIKSVNIL